MLLLSDVRVGFPWPYFPAEAAEIRAALPVSACEVAIAKVIAEARHFLSSPAIAERATDIRPNARTQIQRLTIAVDEARDALKALDREALLHLSSTAELPDEAPLRFLTAVYAFGYNRGLIDLPIVNVIGRKPNRHINELQRRLKVIWEEAHKPRRRPTRGWPRFRDACLDPIDPAPPADKKSRQDQLLSAKRREKSRDLD
jgi:hypothetical protein